MSNNVTVQLHDISSPLCHIFLNSLHLVMSIILVLGILKITVFSTLFYKCLSVFDNHSPKTFFNNCVDGKIWECLFDTTQKTPSTQEVETLKLQLSTYNSFFTGETQEDACECLMLLIEIMDKGLGLCPTNDNISSTGSFSELIFSFVLAKYIICDRCTVKSSAFETTSLLYATQTDCTSTQELLMQEHKQKMYKICSCCGRDT